MEGIELSFQIAYGAVLLMILSALVGIVVSGWWGWKNKDWLFRGRP